MTEKFQFSNSEIQTYKRCKRKWWLGFYRQLMFKNEQFAGKPTYIGNRVHEALDAYYSQFVPDNANDLTFVPQDPIAVIMQGIARDMEEFPQQTEQLEKDRDLCLAVMEGYLEWVEEEGVDEDFEFVGAEMAIVAPLQNEFGDELIGKIDARVRRLSDGARLFIDHKTVAGFAEYEKMADMSEQFMQYGLLERLAQEAKSLEYQERTDGGVYNLLRKSKRTARAKPPFYKRIEVRHNDETLRSFYLRVYGTVGAIRETRRQLDAGVDHRIAAYPTPDSSCSWQCPFFAVCKMFDDGSDAEGFIRDYYEPGDVLERYRDTTKENV